MTGFSPLDWSVVFALLGLTTWIGHRLAPPQRTARDFFLGARQLPWYAVAASIVATEISAVTFVSLPFVVFRPGGDATYLQIAILGAFLARVLVAFFLVPAYFEREVFSPYDYVGGRLGAGAKRVTSALFTLGGVLAQCARVYVTAVVLEVVLARELGWLEARTGVAPLVSAVALITLVAVAWTWMGGIATVVWTDAVLFLVFLAGLSIALVVACGGVDGGLAEVFAQAREAGKLRVLDPALDLTRAYTLPVGLVAAPIWFAAVFGTDQLFAQRVLCCGSAREARKAVLWSQASMVVSLLAVALGLALFAFYRENEMSALGASLVAEKGDRVLPVFVLEEVPAGFRGLILAGVFAAAISSLDSILAALSQTALAVFDQPRRRRRLGLEAGAPWPPEVEAQENARALRVSRRYVLGAAVVLATLAVLARIVHDHYPSILDMSLAMAGYTQGALLAGIVLALRGDRAAGRGFLFAAPLSVLAVFAAAWHAPAMFVVTGVGALALAAAWVRVRRDAFGTRGLLLLAGLAVVFALQVLARFAPAEGGGAPRSLAYPWFVPLGALVALAFSYGLAATDPEPDAS